ncbi:transcription-repair coupling factor [Helicobacter bilis ATCC 43879]|uniref:Transcription-repair-coupling factor n=2 Tax=Helicobacteraceae TaxID=72293 RepID=C3XFZ1_9HELI|nr:transcription-repair coupling factor [Helicobacter bilis ATCC 43879]
MLCVVCNFNIDKFSFFQYNSNFLYHLFGYYMFKIQSAIYETFIKEAPEYIQCSLQDLIACDILQTQIKSAISTNHTNKDNSYIQLLLNLSKDSNICHTESLGEVSKNLESTKDSKKDFSTLSQYDKILDSKITHPKPCTHPDLVENLESSKSPKHLTEILTHVKISSLNQTLTNHTKNKNTPQILICSSEEILLAKEALCATLNLISMQKTKKEVKESTLPIVLPDIRLSPFDSTQSFYEEFHELFAKLALWYENDCKQILISPPHTLMAFMPSKELLHSFCVRKSENIVVKDFIAKLIHYGYEHVEIVEMQGEFSHRGDIIDIFIPSFEFPVRISLFDTEIEEINFFNHETQLSQNEMIENLKIYPAIFSLDESQHTLLESRIKELDNTLECSINSLGFWFLKDIGGLDFLKTYSHVFTPKALSEYLLNLEFVMPEVLPETNTEFYILQDSINFRDLEPLKLSQIHNTLKLNSNKDITIFSPTNAMLKSYNLESLSIKTKQIITPFYLNITSNEKLFLSLQKPQIMRKRKVKLELDALKVGAYVVHSEYGIGIFEAIKQVSIMGGLKDFISIIYANDDRLLLPVENLNMIEQYSAYDSVVRIDKLGKSSFLKLKDSIKEKLFAIANEIIRLQAQRTLAKGVKIELETPDQITAFNTFESSRGFTLTQDQTHAIQESLKDLKSGMIMDRLLNGDVGFGKTEVAMSLCFASALNDFNSIVLVPTTLLCNQHFESFKERLHNTKLPNGKILYIAKIDRFTTATQKRAIQENFKDNIQIIVGTHSLFNLEIENLGLMVIDEEHKFGVKQKELLKQKSLTTHILSMSATPIPRTLNMAYSKLKSISELKTPPFFKQESKTFVKVKQDSLIKEVILRELRRGGQVFYIFNNIAKITTIQSYLHDLLPQLRILILHSQINPKDTEKGMLAFLKKEYDLLLCTSIVESGIHLPNANTIIIDDAHNFGIADLHQLRGRVGRGKHVGFCYLLTNENITQDAAKRLLSLEKNSYLGSGAALAYHDLEIRGGGNLLGEAQSGHIKQVGFGMYVRMLEDTLQSLLQNEQQEQKVDIKLSVSAFLNESLVSSERMRLDLYRRLSQVKSEFEVREIEGEIEQRFGRLDIYSLQFLEIIIIKTLALQLGIKAISNAGYNISLIGHDDTRITLQSPTKDDDDILNTIKTKLKELLGMLKK